jgi:transposase
LSLIAGASFWRICFRFFNGAIKGPQLVEFLRALTATVHGKLLIIWDGLPAHRSRVVREYIDSLNGRIALERLPGYALELNPVEYLFGYAKAAGARQPVPGHDRRGQALRHPATQITATPGPR